MEGTRSKASIAGHPLHPAVVPFPIAFLTGAALTDIAAWLSAESFWGRASFWLLAAGLVGGAAAFVLGLIDFLSIPRARQGATGWAHFIGNSAVLVISAINLAMRLSDPLAPIVPVGLLLSLVTAGLLALTGWLGGELTFRHKVGMVE